MIWNFIQLFPAEVLDDFVIDDIPSFLTPLLYAMRYVRNLLSSLSEYGDLILFFLSVAVILLSFLILIWNCSLKCCSSCRCCNCCSCCNCCMYIEYKALRINLPEWLQSLFLDVLYIIILEALLKAFVCKYSCNYDPTNSNITPYPYHAIYPSIDCSSWQYNTAFGFALFSVGYYHARASYFIVHQDEESGIVSSTRFRYFECILRV